MFTLSVRADFGPTVAKLNAVKDGLGDQVLVRSLNETGAEVKTEMSKRIRDEFAVTASLVRERLELQRASRTGNRFTVDLRGDARHKRRSLNLIHFVRSVDIKRGGGRRLKSGQVNQIQFKILKQGGKGVLPGAFIGNKGRTVFIRTGIKRLPIRAVSTVDIPSMFNTKRVQQPVQRLIPAIFAKKFEANQRYLMSRLA